MKTASESSEQGQGIVSYRGTSLGNVIVSQGVGLGIGLPPRRDLMDHSAGPFVWGNKCEGSAQFALALLAHAAGDQSALLHYRAFQEAVIADLKTDDWTLTASQIRGWMEDRVG